MIDHGARGKESTVCDKRAKTVLLVLEGGVSSQCKKDKVRDPFISFSMDVLGLSSFRIRTRITFGEVWFC